MTMTKAALIADLEDIKAMLTDAQGAIGVLSDGDIETLENIQKTSTWGKIALAGHLLSDMPAIKDYVSGMITAATSLKLS